MPIFMIGTQRSGSNLLRLMLHQSPDLVAPHPPHILQKMRPLLPLYGDLGDAERFNLLVDDVCRLVETNPVAWRESPFDRPHILERCKDRSLLSVLAAIYDQHMCDFGARDWVCKSLANVHFLDEIKAHFNGAVRFIYLYRDGRDVALSFQKAVVGEKHIYSIAKQWHEDQQAALAFCRDHEDAAFGLAYEDLTDDPAPVLKRLCDFLGIGFNRDMLAPHSSQEAAATSVAGDLWSNVSRPILQNSQKFRTQMPPESLRIFEAVAGDSLRALGYELVSGPPADGVPFDAAEIARFEEENQQLKERFMRDNAGSADLKNRAPQEEVVQSIRRRAADG
ncbi:MAG: sulfotransferase [Gammaproteobacteria bacterium]|nr:sulfotransferase [Gammaproteobacteria bacterium]